MKEITSIPNASRTFEALRNLGYNLNSSIADLVDNALTKKVKSKNIAISLVVQSGKFYCTIQDDGRGMTQGELEEAMRLGADIVYKKDNLGKFGMGMKTASLSHCHILTVISKTKNSHLAGYRWSMGQVKKRGWSLLQLSIEEVGQLMKKEAIRIGGEGTIILWDDLFLLNQEYKSYNSTRLGQNFHFRLVEQLRLHLSMVYHRFLDGSLGSAHKVTITLNNEKLVAWDPFCRQEPLTEKIILRKQVSDLRIPGHTVPIRIEAYILPNKENFSSEGAWRAAKGLLPWNDAQGYYIYRSNRIIRFGGWNGTKAKDEHDKLARLSIDIDPSLDKLFRITVNKARVQFPELLFNHLKNTVNPFVVKKAKSKYNKSGDNLKIKNSFRRNESSVTRVSQGLIDENGIQIHSTSNNRQDVVEVKNPSGTWLSNKISEFLKYGSENDFEIVSDHFAGNQLWKIVCSHNSKFKVIVNASHPFYSHVYKAAKNRSITGALDALIFSLAFAELYNRNNQNEQLFDTFKTVCSQALKKLTKEVI